MWHVAERLVFAEPSWAFSFDTMEGGARVEPNDESLHETQGNVTADGSSAQVDTASAKGIKECGPTHSFGNLPGKYKKGRGLLPCAGH